MLRFGCRRHTTHRQIKKSNRISVVILSLLAPPELPRTQKAINVCYTVLRCGGRGWGGGLKGGGVH